MATPRWVKGALIPSTFEVISLANSTSLAPSTTTRGADVLHVSVETQNARYRADTTAPTLNTGVLLQKDNDYWFEGYTGNANMKFQRTTGTCTLNVQAFTHVGTQE